MTTVFIIIALLLFAVASIFYIFWETKWVEVNHYKVPLGKGRLEKPVHLVHITDIHIGPWALPTGYKPAVRFINSLEPDYIAITGDFVTHFKELIPGCARILSELKSNEAVMGVLGNHDYWIDSGYLTKCLEEAGVEMLINRARLSNNGCRLSFVGIDDPYTHHDNLGSSIADIPGSQVKVLLSHSPDIIDKAAELGIDLILVGHTHGGQVRFPLVGAIYIPSRYGTKYDKGWFREKNTQMYVNKGLGGIFPPVRFLCRREIAVMNLVAEDGEPELLKRELVYL